MAAQISLRFLGVRSIHSAPGSENTTTGGNTSCLEIRDGNQRIFVNAGFGINVAGDELFGKYLKEKVPTNCTVLLSDFLWDTTMGLPFFTPIHFKSTEIDILTGAAEAVAMSGLDDAASNLFSPFNGVKGFRADISVRTIDAPMHLGNWNIQALCLPHPLTPYPVTLWRLTHADGADIGITMLCDPTDSNVAAAGEFFRDCKTLVCAATSSGPNDPWSQNRTSFEDALRLAVTARSDELLLTQFHPDMNDQALQTELLKLRATQLARTHTTGAKPLGIHLGSEIEIFTPACNPTLQKVG